VVLTTVVACVRLALDGKITREVRTFATTTSGLLLLLAWLTEMGCTHVAMEATGVYWKPVWNILSDGDFELVLANAAHIKNVPGRKTDVSDATWIADLLAHGLIRSSFIPDQEIQELRELLRTRKQLGRQQSRHVQRLQKTLEGANIKLDSVITDIVGKSGRAMIRALIAGETDPVKLAALADGRIKASPQELREALRGRVRDHHRFLLHLHLQHIEFADAAILDIDRNVAALIARMDEEVEAGRTFQTLIALLITIPGIDVLAARIILSEIGPDMTRFPTAGHLLSWAGLCPRNDESAGKRRSTRLRKGDRWLKTLLIQCAWAAKRKKDAMGPATRVWHHRCCLTTDGAPRETERLKPIPHRLRSGYHFGGRCGTESRQLVGGGSCSSSDPTTIEEAAVRSGCASGIGVAMARPGNQSRRPHQTDCASI
jgi:transposase